MVNKETSALPHWACKSLNAPGLEKIRQAIFDVEKTTSAEIVPMVVRSSSTTGHVPLVLFVGFVLLFEAALVFIPDLPSHSLAHLGSIFLAAFCSKAFSLYPSVERWLTPTHDQEAQVNQRAVVEFYQSNFHLTEGATGILIFVSLMERKAVLLADKAINDKVDPKVWDEGLKLLLNDIKDGDMSSGFVKAIEACGKVVAPIFPIQPDDVNELKDQLIIKD